MAEETFWDLEVTVVDNTCDLEDTPPYWTPGTVLYDESADVDLDPLAAQGPRSIGFSVSLGLYQGMDNCTYLSIDPSGDVEASISLLDPELTVDVDCAGANICDAGTLFSGGGTIYGTIDATEVTTIGSKTARLTVVWTPAE